MLLVVLALLGGDAFAADFRVEYVGRSGGLRWSQYLDSYQNGGCHSHPDPDCPVEKGPDGKPVIVDGYARVVVRDSAAALECWKMGGRLPAVRDLRKLLLDFDHEEVQGMIRLTKRGRAQMAAIFPRLTEEKWWSSSVLSRYPAIALHLDGATGAITTASRALFLGFGVRCVK